MNHRTLLLLRVVVFVLAVAFLYVRLRGDQGMHVLEALRRPGAWSPALLLALLGLMVLNWGLEARKWQVLVRRVQPIGWWRAFTATIAGTSIGAITPNRVGEFAGRVLFLEPGHRIEGAFATLLGSIAQFVTTLLFGACAAIALLIGAGPGSALPMQALTWSAVAVGGVATVLYFEPALLGRVLLLWPFLRRFERHVRVLESFGRPMLLHVFLLSVLRYAVFTVQFVVVLAVFAGSPWEASLPAVPLVFLVTTLVPTTVLTEIGVRGSAAVAFLPGDPLGLTLATTLLWVVNLLLPAAVGSLLVLFVRIRTERTGP